MDNHALFARNSLVYRLNIATFGRIGPANNMGSASHL
jgi:hypothetical protein